MLIKGTLHAAAPIYRGNARKTLFTRDGDGRHRLVSLAGEIRGTAQSLMDAFTGQSKNGKNMGLLNQLWQRLYASPMPDRLIEKVECKLKKECYPRNSFFDMRMGIRLDEDRWAVEANANYKMETLMRDSLFDLSISVNDALLKKEDNAARLYYVLQEIMAERFWFGAGKSKGLGRCRLEANLPIPEPKSLPAINPKAGHLRIDIGFNAQNPVLVGWNWGKVDPHTPSFQSVEARLLIGAMRNLPDSIRQRLEMALGGAILSPEDWKQKFTEYLPRVIAIRLRESASSQSQCWVLPEAGIKKLGKGKHALSKDLMKAVESLSEKPFSSEAEAEAAITEAMGKKANMVKRVTGILEQRVQARQELDANLWKEISEGLGIDIRLGEKLAESIGDEAALMQILTPACKDVLPSLFLQVDQHIKMLQSDMWVDEEIRTREEHLHIKKLIKSGAVSEFQWNDPSLAPEGVRKGTWKEFLNAHARVRFSHMLNKDNLNKSIVNDENHIKYLKTYRNMTRQELAQPHHIDFRAGGIANHEISQKYGKPYDTLFMRMLVWKPSLREQGTWEAFIPGSTVKGAFRKRASQLLKTLWGEGRKCDFMLERLFGKQGQRGLIFFSDAHLTDPDKAEKSWCSTDGVRMDPKTGQPIETAKRDYLFAYGKELRFRMQMDIQDLSERDAEFFSLFLHLLRDFQNGDIPLGGEKTSGFGWVKAEIEKLECLVGKADGIIREMLKGQTLKPAGIWQGAELSGKDAVKALTPVRPLQSEGKSTAVPPTARAGFISHRAFGGYCGQLHLEARILTPVNIKESGEPSFTAKLDEGPVNGWDFFSLSPGNAQARSEERIYAIPGRSLKGMIRHIYTIASDSRRDSTVIDRLTPAESLFGWVGDAPNQALMGRLSFDFARFDSPELAWFKVPYPYGDWQYTESGWKQISKAQAAVFQIEKNWRLFPHAPLAPIASRLDSFTPDTFQARYCRAIMPGSKARFTLRFWNLSEEEFARLLWCILLEPDLAHKIGNNRYAGFGSLRLHLLPESHLIDWEKRYTGDKWRKAVEPEKIITPKVIAHMAMLRKGLNAQHI